MITKATQQGNATPVIDSVVRSKHGYTKDRLLKVVSIDTGEEWESTLYECTPMESHAFDNGNTWFLERNRFEFPVNNGTGHDDDNVDNDVVLEPPD